MCRIVLFVICRAVAFFYSLMKSPISLSDVLNIKFLIWKSLGNPEYFLILRKIEKGIIIKFLAVHIITDYYCHILINIIFSIQILKKFSKIKIHKTHPLGAQFFHKTKGHTDKLSCLNSQSHFAIWRMRLQNPFMNVYVQCCHADCDVCNWVVGDNGEN